MFRSLIGFAVFGALVGLIIGLNPSTAGAKEDDHTIRKEKEFTRRWGWSGFWKANMFVCIETHSKKLKQMPLAVATGHTAADRVLEELIPRVPVIVVCWGSAVPKEHRSRIQLVCEKIRLFKDPIATVLCFGLSQDGNPLHPLMLSYDTPLMPYLLPGRRPSRRDNE